MLRSVLASIFFIFTMSVSAQKIATLTVPINNTSGSFHVPVSVSLDDITVLPDSMLSLFEITDGDRRSVAYQIEHGQDREMHWLLSPNKKGQKKRERVFELVKGKPTVVEDAVQVLDQNGALLIQSSGNNLLRYVYKTHYPPEGVDSAYKRSGFIHPFWTPNGQELTRIDPPDHYHHFGLWNPWTRVLFDGDTVDFWNIRDGKGTVRFAHLISRNQGAIYGDYQTVHEHIAFKKDGSEKTALNEVQSVRIYKPDTEDDYYIMDITVELDCASASPVILQEYRYGGLGWRATEAWNDDNSEVLTSEGNTRKNADGTKARWVIVQGSLGADYGGALMMSYPINYNHPEPLRIWPEGTNGRGDVFANFSPTKDRDWPLYPGNTYVQKYRFLVYNGEMDEQRAEEAWQQYAHPPKVAVDLSAGAIAGSTSDVKESRKVLLYTKNGEGFVHDNIPYAVEAIKKLGAEYDFQVDVSEDPSVFTEDNLKQYKLLIFSSTNNDVFDTDDQRLAFRRYIQAGGGFVGIHSVTGTERNWTWFKKMIGGSFSWHAVLQEFTVVNIRPDHPSLEGLPKRWVRKDECYFTKEMYPGIKVLMAHDLNSLDLGLADNQERLVKEHSAHFGELYPAVWHQKFDGGTIWISTLGHMKESYQDPVFIQHILQGIQYVFNETDTLDYNEAYARGRDDEVRY